MLEKLLLILYLLNGSFEHMTKYFYSNKTEKYIFTQIFSLCPEDYSACSLSTIAFPCPFNSSQDCTIQNYSNDYKKYLKNNPTEKKIKQFWPWGDKVEFTDKLNFS